MSKKAKKLKINFTRRITRDLASVNLLSYQWLLNVCLCLFTIMLKYYCMELTTNGLWLLDRANVFTTVHHMNKGLDTED